MRILIAEDDFASRRLLMEYLEPYGLCHVAANGQEAVEAVQKELENGEPYDLVCLDIRMPVMDGQEALKGIRKLEADRGILLGDGMKIVMTTALSDPKSILGAFNQQCEAYLVKPITRKALIDTLCKLELIEAEV